MGKKFGVGFSHHEPKQEACLVPPGLVLQEVVQLVVEDIHDRQFDLCRAPGLVRKSLVGGGGRTLPPATAAGHLGKRPATMRQGLTDQSATLEVWEGWHPHPRHANVQEMSLTGGGGQ